MQRTKESDKERAQRLERQIDRLKFKHKKEIEHLKTHLARGKDLLHRVTQEAMGKQNERDLAVARAEILNKLLITVLERSGDLKIPIEDVKKAGDKRFVDIKVDGDMYILTLGTKEEAGNDGEAEQVMVSAPGQEVEPSGDCEGQRDDQTEGISDDSGASD